MQLRMWMYDLAREQCPTHDFLRRLCRLTLDSGYNAIGIYMEHRFAYPSLPWLHGKHALTPEVVIALQDEFPDLQIIPFINLLGHFEGALYTSGGEQYAEQRFVGLQACPSNQAFRKLCEQIIDDTVAIFRSEIIHVGGDETAQLGACPTCAARVAASSGDGKAEIYAEHMGALAARVRAAGRRAAVWGDMFYDHPTALDALPAGTIIFDWQYFRDVRKQVGDGRYPVVGCPALHAYNAAWMHLAQSEANIRDHMATLSKDKYYGICVTTWEAGLFGNYETMLPAIAGAGEITSHEPTFEPQQSANESQPNYARYRPVREAPTLLAAYRKLGPDHEAWAKLMGIELQDCGGLFQFTGIRSSLKCRLLLYSNPFLLWLRDRDDLLGEPGETAYVLADRAIALAPTGAMRGVSEFLKLAIEFVRHAEAASVAYMNRDVGKAMNALAPCRQVFESLENIARANHVNSGGSLADIERCKAAKHHVEIVLGRIKQYGDGSLGYRPSFEMITHPKFMPHDQAGWWLINKWANE